MISYIISAKTLKGKERKCKNLECIQKYHKSSKVEKNGIKMLKYWKNGQIFTETHGQGEEGKL